MRWPTEWFVHPTCDNRLFSSWYRDFEESSPYLLRISIAHEKFFLPIWPCWNELSWHDWQKYCASLPPNCWIEIHQQQHHREYSVIYDQIEACFEQALIIMKSFWNFTKMLNIGDRSFRRNEKIVDQLTLFIRQRERENKLIELNGRHSYVFSLSSKCIQCCKLITSAKCLYDTVWNNQ